MIKQYTLRKHASKYHRNFLTDNKKASILSKNIFPFSVRQNEMFLSETKPFCSSREISTNCLSSRKKIPAYRQNQFESIHVLE